MYDLSRALAVRRQAGDKTLGWRQEESLKVATKRTVGRLRDNEFWRCLAIMVLVGLACLSTPFWPKR